MLETILLVCYLISIFYFIRLTQIGMDAEQGLEIWNVKCRKWGYTG